MTKKIKQLNVISKEKVQEISLNNNENNTKKSNSTEVCKSPYYLHSINSIKTKKNNNNIGNVNYNFKYNYN